MMAGRQKKRAPAPAEASLFDQRGTVIFPRRIEVLGSVHGNQIFGLAHAGFAARVQVVPTLARGVTGFTTHLPGWQPIFVAPRTTSVLANTTATLVIPDFTTADELFQPERQKSAIWCAPRPVNPSGETTGVADARCQAIVKSWDGLFKFELDDPEQGQPGLRRPQIGALYAVLAHWTTTDADATVVMPTGTGKTEAMLALLVCAKLQRLMVVVPNSALRDQIAEKFLTLGKLAECGCIPPDTRPPVVARLRHRPKTEGEVDAIFKRANVVIATMQVAGQCTVAVQKRMAELCSHLFIDEAHHIAARTWAEFKTQFRERPIVQFTATPFRTDGKRVDGRFIYSYPLARAQKEGYFRAVTFSPVEEFDPTETDLAVARRASELLRADVKSGFDHLLMARVDTTEHAADVERIYAQELPEFRPVTIHTKIAAQERKRRLDALHKRESRVLICVDMFGEGFRSAAIEDCCVARQAQEPRRHPSVYWSLHARPYVSRRRQSRREHR